MLWHEDGHSDRRKEWSWGRERKRRGEDDVRTGNVLVVQFLQFPCGYRERREWYPDKTISIVQEGNSTVLLFALPCWQVQRGSSSSMLSFTPPPPSACLAELACEWFLAETAAWTDSRWAKEEARLSFIQTLLWIAAGGWCIQIPQTLTGLFSWWRPWGWGDGEKNQRCCFITNPEDNNVHKQQQRQQNTADQVLNKGADLSFTPVTFSVKPPQLVSMTA